jgi:hypothetical protein
MTMRAIRVTGYPYTELNQSASYDVASTVHESLELGMLPEAWGVRLAALRDLREYEAGAYTHPLFQLNPSHF